jgi:hypothetical protein
MSGTRAESNDNVTVMNDPQIPVISFAVALPSSALQNVDDPASKNNLVGNNGIVGTIIVLQNSVMVWVGWGELDMNPSDDASEEHEFGSGRPTQGQCLVAMPRLGYKGAFGGTSSKDPSCSQIIASASSEDQMLASQMASRLTTRSDMAVFVSCQLTTGGSNGPDEFTAGLDSEVLSHRAAAMAEKEVWRIIQSHNIDRNVK